MELRQSDSCDISQLHYKAKRCLVLRNFEDALQICYEVLDLQKIDHRSAPSTNSVRDSSEQCTIPFVVIAIQAYAEINQSQAAIDFARKVFGNIERFPSEVLKLCICLLMKASKHAEAVEVAEKWLCFEDNFSQQNYLEVTEFYIKHVLLPQKLNEKVQQFLETNRALTPEQRQVMLDSLTMASERKVESCSNLEAGRDVGEEKTHVKTMRKQVVHSVVVIRMLSVLNKLQRLCRNISFSLKKTSTILRILIFVFFIYALLTATGYHGVTSGSGIFIFWQAVTQAWRAMFSPYHLM